METQPVQPSTRSIASRPSTPRLVNLILLLLALSLVAVSGFLYLENTNLKKLADANPEPSLAASCEYEGMTYQPGEGFPSSDGCNSCSCSPTGEVQCSLMACDGSSTQFDQNNINIRYTNANYGFSFEVPVGWELFEHPNGKFITIGPSDEITKIREVIKNQIGMGALPRVIAVAIDDQIITPYTDELQTVTTSQVQVGEKSATKYEIYLKKSTPTGSEGEILTTIILELNSHNLAINQWNPEYSAEYTQILSTFEFTE